MYLIFLNERNSDNLLLSLGLSNIGIEVFILYSKLVSDNNDQSQISVFMICLEYCLKDILQVEDAVVINALF